jgi:uncharacterized protein
MSELFECARAGRPVPFDVIDMHGHMGIWYPDIPDLSAAGMVAAMDRVGVKSIMCSHMQCTSCDPRRGNREVAAAMSAFPGRILGCLITCPSSEAAVKAEVAWCLEAGFIGVKVHLFQGFPYTYAGYTPAYEAAEEHRLPILFHCYGEEEIFAQVAEIAKHYPHASILMAHARVPAEQGYIRMAREHPNVFIETCISASHRGLIERLVAGAGVEKIVWGADMYCYAESQQIGRVLGAQISDEAKKKILSDNALGILARRRV